MYSRLRLCRFAFIFTFCKKKFNLIGYDKDIKKINSLKKGRSYISNISDKNIDIVNKSKKIKFSTDAKLLNKADIIICCLPTPITKNNSPDMTFIKEFSLMIKRYARKGQIIILESTTYPGTTNDYIASILNKKKNCK